jgi:dihydroorotase
MKSLIKNVLIQDARSPFYGKKLDIEVDKGLIIQAEKNSTPKKGFQIVEGKQLVLCPAFVDLNASSGEPFRLEAETLDSFVETAARGGFAYVAHMPTAEKLTQSKSDVAFLKSKNRESICQVLPIGNMTKSEHEIAALMDMKQAGAVAFSDGNEVSPGLGVLKNVMLYSQGLNGKLMIHPEKRVLSKNGQVNQGIMSLMLGYKGIPKEAEVMAVSEIIQLAQYTDSEILFLNITTPESVKLISAANKDKKQFYTAISSTHLAINESELKNYDTNVKLNPPLRSTKDHKAMVKAAIEGKIDIVYSQHTPCTPEEKVLEFDLASSGIINLQTSALSCIEALGVDNIDSCIELMSTQPAKYLNLELPIFEVGVSGSFTILDLKTSYEFNVKNNKSKSVNSPFLGKKFSTKIVGLISNNKQQFYN